MERLSRFLPFLDLRFYRGAYLASDATAGIIVALLAVPQSTAYAIIAGLPPAMGLYAAALPCVVGSFFRSSRHVITGPSNALSLLVGGAVLVSTQDPVATAVTLALIVGATQLLAGALRLGVLVDYLSLPVVRGYITGAGVLVGLSQMAEATGTPVHKGAVLARIWWWLRDLAQADPVTAAIAAGSVAILLILRKVDRRIPSALLLTVIGVALSAIFDLKAYGIRLVGDLTPVPAGLPPLTVPAFSTVASLLPAALACTVLSLVESNAVARSLAAQSGQRLDTSSEFVGQGLANVVAAFFGGYPTSGSLARSGLNLSLGAKSRLAGAIAGGTMLVILVFLGPLVDRIPLAVLAGILFVLVIDLIDVPGIRRTIKASFADAAAFFATVVGTMVLPLDQAIYLGVGISLVLFLRRARLLIVRDLVLGEGGEVREIDRFEAAPADGRVRPCPAIRILHIEGPLFFGAAGELSAVLDEAIADPELRVLVLRLKRTQAMDVTTATVLEGVGETLRRSHRHLLLAGIRERAVRVLERTGIANTLGAENLFPTEPGWFAAMDRALERALTLCGEHGCAAACPVASYLAAKGKTAASER